MWALENNTTFEAERSFVRDRDGAEIWLVAVRGTFDLHRDGRIMLAERQVPPMLAPQYFGDPSLSPLRYDSDLVRTKSATDVIVHGTAHAPRGHRVAQAVVRLAVGSIDKSVVVRGDATVTKSWTGRLASSPPTEFERLPLTYSRAFGGSSSTIPSGGVPAWEPSNPIGVGLDAREGKPLPNQYYPGEEITPGARLRPASFGPIPASWQPRLGFAGTYDARWQAERQPLVPDDFDDRYFQCAPSDQQVPGFLRGGEQVTLENFTPDGLLRFALPRVSLGFTTSIDGGIVHHRADLHTIIIEPDDARLSMVWHTALPCHHTIYSLRCTRVFEKRRLERQGAEQLAEVTK
ncbi:MAG: DUF2169 domain-containing protein [Phycisphaerales bacterium]